MNLRNISAGRRSAVAAAIVCAAAGCGPGATGSGPERNGMTAERIEVFSVEENALVERERVTLTDAEWRARLDPNTYQVTREGGTECAFTGKLYGRQGAGVYRCVCCGLGLFRSDAKFESGTGWPSFFAPVHERNLRLLEDRSHGMVRTEIRCALCAAHLGHVFPDGPEPTGLRFCINSAALAFQPEGAPAP
jgi:peptide-methionine (R)-S-oxide reductase